MSQIKERPILFSALMVRAILEGRKTVTRRAVRSGFNPEDLEGTLSASECRKLYRELPQHFGAAYFCPYGQPGDRLWVRETFAFADKSGSHDAAPDDHWRPARPGMDPEIYRCWYRASDGHTADGFWKPSIHMPRWACRILLEITDVRVERLQDISEDQAKAEGCFFTDYGQQCFHGGTVWKDVGDCPAEAGHQQRNGWAWDKTTNHEQCLLTPRFAFANLWNSVGGDWQANPWVWVVEFNRVTP